MGYRQTSATGSTEAVIDDNCGMKKFYSIANLLVKECKVRFVSKEDFTDSIDWHFNYKGHSLTLHYNIYNGVSVCNKHKSGNEALNDLATILETKFY